MSETTFEQELEQLEKIVNELESGDVSLEQAIAQFEKGMILSKSCAKKLDMAEKKIAELTSGKDEQAS